MVRSVLARLPGERSGLRSNLETFIDPNGNRNKAASELTIHRSTLDHRLSRIEQITSCWPTVPWYAEARDRARDVQRPAR